MSQSDPIWRRYQRLTGADPRADVDDELRFHWEELLRRYRATGMDEAAAERAARAQFGDLEGLRRHLAETSSRRLARRERREWWLRLRHDARVALRRMVRQPGFTAAAVITLALGIGATAAVFSVVNAALLRPLPYPDADRIVRLDEFVDGHAFTASPPNFTDFRAQARSFSAMAALYYSTRTLTGEGDPIPVTGAMVTGDFFSVMGVHPARGRAFTADELVYGQTDAVILSDALWRSAFGSRPDLVGRTIQLSGRSYQVVGIMPPGFDYPPDTRLWLPLAFSEHDLTTQRGAHYLTIVGRLRDGVALDAGVADVAGIARHLAQQYANTNKDYRATGRSLRDDLVGDTPRRALIILLGAVALVTLIACANVANLLLARGEARRRELAMRASLGARPRDLIGMALTESLLLSVIGGLAGLLVAWSGTRALDTLRPESLQDLGAARVDLPVLGFTIALSVLTGLLFGLAPAFQAVRAGASEGALRPENRGNVGSREGWRTRSVLVAVELALAVMLLAGAGLLVKSFVRLAGVSPGFNPNGVLTFTVSLPDARYPDADHAEQFFQRLVDGLRVLPGVASAEAISGLPLEGYNYTISTYSIDGRHIESTEQPSTQIRVVTPGLFRTLGIRLRRGRAFTAADREGAPNVVVVNEAAARLLFNGDDPLGHRMHIGTSFGLGRGRAGGEIVGIVDDIHDAALGTPPRATVYLAHAQFPVDRMAVTMRAVAGVDPVSLTSGMRGVLRGIDDALPPRSIRTLKEVTRQSVAQPRFAMLLLGTFALVALALSAVGIFGVMAYIVGQRTREIGVRMALGAGGRTVVAETVRRATRPIVIGVALGLLGAYALTRSMAGLLYDVAPRDPATFAGVAIGLAAVAVVAAWLPARRASRVDPVVALRSE